MVWEESVRWEIGRKDHGRILEVGCDTNGSGQTMLVNWMVAFGYIWWVRE